MVKFSILSPQFSEFWGYRYAPPCLTQSTFLIGKKSHLILMEVNIFIYVCKFSDYAYKYNISQAQNAQ